MVRAKNYETMSTFVKVMQKKLRPLFFRTRCTWHTVAAETSDESQKRWMDWKWREVDY